MSNDTRNGKHSGEKGPGWEQDLTTWARQRKAQLAATEENAVTETMRRLKQLRVARAGESDPDAQARANPWRIWPILTFPQLAGLGAVALIIVLLLLIDWNGSWPASQLAQTQSHPLARPNKTMVRMEYQVRCSVMPEAEAPRQPLLQVSRYEGLF